MQYGSSGALTDAKIVANTGYGIELSGDPALEVFGGMIKDNASEGAWITEDSFLHLNEVQVTGNTGHGVAIARDSGVVISGNSSVTGNVPFYQLACQGEESSVAVDYGAVVGPMEACSGF